MDDQRAQDAPEVLDASGAGRRTAVEAAAAALMTGELAVLPTDTVYGVAADAFNPDATRRVFRAKRRARTVPLPVLVRSPKQLLGLTTRIPPEADRLMAAYWPGPVTLVVVADDNLQWDLGNNQGTVAVRMPFDDVTLDVIREVGPLATTSANRHGKRPATTVAEALEQLGDHVRAYVDDGPRTSGPASAVVDLTRREPHVLRSGAIPDAELLAVATGELDPLEATQVPAPEGPSARTGDDEQDGPADVAATTTPPVDGDLDDATPVS